MGRGALGVRWSTLEAQAPALASDVLGLIDRFRFALIGTVRRDGSVRISAVETHVVGDELMVVMLPRTHKAADVRRDPRVVLQSPITSAGDPGGEFKLRGRAAIVEDDEVRAAAADTIEKRSGWRPQPSWLFLKLLFDDVTHIGWRTDGTAELSRWTFGGGLRDVVELRLNMESGGYQVEDGDPKGAG